MPKPESCIKKGFNICTGNIQLCAVTINVSMKHFVILVRILLADGYLWLACIEDTLSLSTIVARLAWPSARASKGILHSNGWVLLANSSP